MTHPTIKRFQNAVRELRSDKKDLKRDSAGLKTNQSQLSTARSTQKSQLSQIASQRQQTIDSFEPGGLTPTGSGPAMTDPMLTAALKALDAKKAGVKSKYGKIITHETKQIATSKKVIAHDKKEITGDRKLALGRLHAAEMHTDTLNQTNQLRHSIGLHAIKHQLSDTKTVAGCARTLLASKNVSFWSGLSTGSDRKNLQLLAEGKKAFVPATGEHVMPRLKMMQALVDMAKHGPIMINALTGGSHSPNSNHYHGTAVDLDLSTGNASMIQSIAAKHGGVRNYETDHIHLDF